MRFKPLFFSLFFRMIRVCLVFDAIFIPFVIPILLLSFYAPVNAYSQNWVTLAKGQQHKISLPSLQNYSIGNGEILSAKYLKRKKVLMIKAKKLGHSDLQIFLSSGKTKSYSFYILPKRTHQKILEIAELVKHIGLKSQFQGNFLSLSGQITKLKQYKALKKILRSTEVETLQLPTLSTEVQKTIRNQIFKKFFEKSLHQFSCRFEDLYLRCTVPVNRYADFKSIESSYFLKLSHSNHQHLGKNLKTSLYLVASSNSHQWMKQTGYHKVEDWVKNKGRNFFSENKIHFENHKLYKFMAIKFQTLTSLGKKFSIKWGTENTITDWEKTQWKFSGFKLNGLIKSQQNSLSFKYSTSINSNEGENFQGGKKTGEVFVKKNTFLKISELELKNKGRNLGGVPLLEKIPLLGLLFKKNHSLFSYEKISFVIFIGDQN